MRLKVFASGIAVAAALALVGLGSSARAEDPPVGGTELSDAADIVVTATRTPESGFDLPAAVSVVGGDDYRGGRLRRTLTDGLLDVPSVMVQKTAYGQASPFIRGFTGYQTLMLVDGIRLNNSTFRSGPNQYWSTIDAFTTDRVEIVRGPASVLYGSDAVGGTANAIARSAVGHADGETRGRLFSRWSSAEHSWLFRGEGSTRRGDVAVVAGATYKSFGDLDAGRPTGRQPETGYRERAGDFRIDWDLDEDQTVTFALQRVQQDDVPRTHKTVDAVPFHGTDVGTELQRELSHERTLTYVRWAAESRGGWFDDAEVTLSQHRQDEERFRVRDSSRTDVQGVDVTTFGLQAQISKWTDIGGLTFGVEWWSDDVDSFRNDFTNGALSLRRVQGPVADDAGYDTFGAYLQDEIHAGCLSIVTGLRYTRSSADADRVDNPLIGGGDPATPGNVIGIDDSWSNVVGSVRVIRPLGNDWNIFGGVSQAFRAPNLSDLTRLDDTSGFETPSPDLDEEEYLTYEVGVRGRRDGWTAQTVAWYTDIDGMIVPSPTGRLIGGTPEVRKSNVGDGWASGLEVEGAIELDDDWTLTGAASWMDGEVDQLTPSLTSVAKPLSRMMPLTGSLTATYAPHGAGWSAWASGRAASRADELSLKDRTDTSRIPAGGTPRYAVLSVGTRVKLTSHATLSAVLENVAGTDYRIHGSGVNEPGRNLVLALDLTF